jgi:ferrous iron transport protein A
MPLPKTVADLKDGEEATITRVRGNGPFRTRVVEMGLVRGSRLQLVGQAPLGDPLEVKVRGCLLALRRDEARNIEVAAELP